MAHRVGVPGPSLPPQMYYGVPSALRLGGQPVSQVPVRPAMPYRPAKVNPNAGRSKKHMNMEGHESNSASSQWVYAHKQPVAKPRAPERTRGDIMFVRRPTHEIISSNPAYYIKSLSALNYYLRKHHAYECNETAEQIISTWSIYGVCAGVKPVQAHELKSNARPKNPNAILPEFENVEIIVRGECQFVKNIWMVAPDGKQLDVNGVHSKVYLLLVRRYFDEDAKLDRRKARRLGDASSSEDEDAHDGDHADVSDHDDDDTYEDLTRDEKSRPSTKRKPPVVATAATTSAATTVKRKPIAATTAASGTAATSSSTVATSAGAAATPSAVDTKTPTAVNRPPPTVPPPPVPALGAPKARPFYWRFQPLASRVEPDVCEYSSWANGWTGACIILGRVNWVHNAVLKWHREELERYIYARAPDWHGEAELPTISVLVAWGHR